MFGRPAAEAIGQHLQVIIPERWRTAHVECMARLSTGGRSKRVGRTLQLAGLRADGTEFPVELLLSAWRRRGQLYFTAIVRDVSEREALHGAARPRSAPRPGLPLRAPGSRRGHPAAVA